MEFWIPIAAAASGCLAHFWQKSFQNSKEAAGNLNDEDDDHPPSTLTSSTRKCHYASSLRRSVEGRFLQKWHGPELSQDGVIIPDGCPTDLYLPFVDDSESWEAQASRKGVRGDACTCPSPSTPKKVKRRHAAALSCSINGSNTSFRCLARSSFNTIWPQKYCDFVFVKDKALFHLAEDDCGCCVSNLYSEDELDSCGVNKMHDRCSIRCVSKHESNMGNAVRACLPNRAWTRGYHDQPEDVCASGLSDAHIKHECEVASGWKVRSNQVDERGRGNNLPKILLFNYGVGIGMMFAIMLNKHGTQQRIEHLEEAMSALKDLEGEIQGRKKLRLGFDDTRDIKEKVSPKQSCSMLKLLQKVCRLVEQVRMSLVTDSASVSTRGSEGPQERARLEAELEAELERMEMHFSPRNATNFCGRYTNEDGLEMGTIAQGELPTRHIHSDVDDHSSTLDGSNSSSHEHFHFGNCAVPPVELAKRLDKVLEARQEEKILELEAEIKRLDNGLHAKEQQLQAWKQRVRHLLQACMSLSSPQKDLYEEAENTSMKALFSSKNKEDLSVVGLECPVSFVNNEDFLTNAVDSVQSLNSSIPQAKTCNVGDETCNEACEGWPQSLDSTGDESASHLHDGLLEGADKRDLWGSGTMMIHPEVVDVSYDSVASGGSNSVLFDIMGSSPFSAVTSMDGEIAAEEHYNNQLQNQVEMETKTLQQGFSIEWDGEITPCSDYVCRSQDICAQDVIDICEDSHGQCGRISSLNTPEDKSNLSDSDEQLGQLLIERIVCKGRKGSLIVEGAQSVMASFDFDDTSLETGLPSG